METEEGKPGQKNKEGDSNDGNGDSVDDDAMTGKLEGIFEFLAARQDLLALFFDFLRF